MSTPPTPSQIPALIAELKRELKAQGRTYADVAAHLGVSTPSVKRVFAEGTFTLDRFEQVCAFVGLTLGELFARCEQRPAGVSTLSAEQEEELLSDLKLLLMCNLVLNRWRWADILAHFDYGEHEAVRYLAKLDRMRIIELQPGNAYRVKASRYFHWRAGGALQRFYEGVVQREFFNSRFDQPGDWHRFATGMLSKPNLLRFHQALERLAREFDDWAHEDASLPLSERYTCSLVLAIRPWAFPPFEQFRRKNVPRHPL
jgi:hypothetical protein